MIARLWRKWRDRPDKAWAPTGVRITQLGGYNFDTYVQKKRAAEARERQRRHLAAIPALPRGETTRRPA